MVNDQLLRVHLLKLMSVESTRSKKSASDDSAADQAAQESDEPANNQLIHEQSSSNNSSHNEFSPNEDEDSTTQDPLLAKQHSSAEHPAKSNLITTTTTTTTTPITTKDATKVRTGMEKVLTPMKRQNSTSSSGGGSAGNIRSAKKRSSWRYLLTPSYKSRSVEFNKLFCDTIPKNERLIADYACALHREILIQGRVYISVNYIAFYSNLFGWITKSIVRLRDIVEICKANTARIIPNAIQIVTKDGEKRVFASFVQRDKSYIMMLRIWQNNLMNERMSQQEIRNLLYFSYGHDLGISDNEEFKINSPDPMTPANVPPASEHQLSERSSVDGNNNSSHDDDQPNNEQSFESTPLGADHHHLSRQIVLSRVDEQESSPKNRRRLHLQDTHSKQAKHSQRQIHPNTYAHVRYNSLDYQRFDRSAGIINELASKLSEINNERALMDNNLSYSPAFSSPVIVDTPSVRRLHHHRTITPNRLGDFYDDAQADPQDSLDELQLQHQHHHHHNTNHNNKRMGSLGASSIATECASDHDEVNATDSNSGADYTEVDMRIIADQHGADDDLDDNDDDDDNLTTCCGCGEHRGQLIADQLFDINIDTLFNLVFTNSKFMRAHMIKRGMTNTTISGWRRSSTNSGGGGGGDGGANSDKSNSSTLSGHSQASEVSNGSAAAAAAAFSAVALAASRLRRQQYQPQQQQQQHQRPVKRKQVRQLNYSVSIDHVWAKQVQVEEKQNICQAKPGVYVLRSQSVNSGIPYADTFSVDVDYCLTRCGPINRSRMLVHASVNFNQKQANWKLAMVKPMIERQSMQGVRDFTANLTESIEEYISESKKAAARSPKSIARHSPPPVRAPESQLPQEGGGGDVDSETSQELQQEQPELVSLCGSVQEEECTKSRRLPDTSGAGAVAAAAAAASGTAHGNADSPSTCDAIIAIVLILIFVALIRLLFASVSTSSDQS